jgi:hypothetical protein
MFEKASRLKLRFESPNGNLSVEDLWDLPLSSDRRANLDDIAKGLYNQMKEDNIQSFVKVVSKADETLQLKFELVKHVIEVRLTEKEASELTKTNKERKQQILALIAQKKNEQLSGKSLEELESLANSL